MTKKKLMERYVVIEQSKFSGSISSVENTLEDAEASAKDLADVTEETVLILKVIGVKFTEYPEEPEVEIYTAGLEYLDQIV